MQYKLMKWLDICEDVVKKHHDRLMKGFEKSIIQGALDAPVDVDREAISRLFSQLTLADKRELPNFVASIPNDQIVQLMTPPIEPGKIAFVNPSFSYETVQWTQTRPDSTRKCASAASWSVWKLSITSSRP